MKRAPSPRPDFVPVCPIEHASGNIIDFPMIQNVASLLWLVNLGCIDLNPWYARCDDVHRPDYLHFDLDPVERSEEHTSELQSLTNLVCRLLLEKKNEHRHPLPAL